MKDYLVNGINTRKLMVALLMRHEWGIYATHIAYDVVLNDDGKLVNPLNNESYQDGTKGLENIADGEWFYLLQPNLSNFDDARTFYNRESLENYILLSPLFFRDRADIIEKRLYVPKYFRDIPFLMKKQTSDQFLNDKYAKSLIERDYYIDFRHDVSKCIELIKKDN